MNRRFVEEFAMNARFRGNKINPFRTGKMPNLVMIIVFVWKRVLSSLFSRCTKTMQYCFEANRSKRP